MAASTDIFVATETFTTNINGAPVTVIKGQTRVRAGHELMKGREAFFAPLTVHFDVEKATSAPGELRGSPDKAEQIKAATVAANAAKNAKPADESKSDDSGDNGTSADAK